VTCAGIAQRIDAYRGHDVAIETDPNGFEAMELVFGERIRP
jgi:hypothetical protein